MVMNLLSTISSLFYQFTLGFTYLGTKDLIALIHPAIAVIWVFPLIGIVSNFAWQTRQRRLQIKSGEKSKIPPLIGKEHLQIGRWLTGSVVGISLIAIAYSIFLKGIPSLQQKGELDNFLVIFICLMFIATIASTVLLYRAKTKVWRGVFATLAGMGLIILGAQEGVWRLSKEWYWSHYYYGIAVSILMLFSLAIVEDIYRDRSNFWRNAHVILNCLALLLFIGQGITGARDLLEIPPVGKQEKAAHVTQVSEALDSNFRNLVIKIQ
jgi:drug/metabolite transporter (DMT)-like permease